MLRKKAVKMPKEDNLAMPHHSKMTSNFFGGTKLTQDLRAGDQIQF